MTQILPSEARFLAILVEDMRIKAITGQVPELNALPIEKQTESLLALSNLKETLLKIGEDK